MVSELSKENMFTLSFSRGNLSIIFVKENCKNQSKCMHNSAYLIERDPPYVSLGIGYDLHVYLGVYHRGDLWCIKSILLLIYTGNFFLTSFCLTSFLCILLMKKDDQNVSLNKSSLRKKTVILVFK